MHWTDNWGLQRLHKWTIFIAHIKIERRHNAWEAILPWENCWENTLLFSTSSTFHDLARLCATDDKIGIPNPTARHTTALVYCLQLTTPHPQNLVQSSNNQLVNGDVFIGQLRTNGWQAGERDSWRTHVDMLTDVGASTAACASAWNRESWNLCLLVIGMSKQGAGANDPSCKVSWSVLLTEHFQAK